MTNILPKVKLSLYHCFIVLLCLLTPCALFLVQMCSIFNVYEWCFMAEWGVLES